MNDARRIGAIIDAAANGGAEALCRRLTPMVTDAAFVRGWLGRCVADLAWDRPVLPAGYADPVCQSLVILSHKRVHLSLAIISAADWRAHHVAMEDAPHIVGFADGWTSIRFLAGNNASIRRFWLERQNGRLHLGFCAPEPVQDDTLLYLENAHETLRFDRVETDAVMVRLLVRDPDAEHAVECDVRTRAVVRVREAQSHHGRIRMILSLLRSLGRRDVAPVIAQNMAAWPAHLRWHAVREALVADSPSGFALLHEVASSDPDTQVRMLARQTCEALLRRHPLLGELDLQAWH